MKLPVGGILHLDILQVLRRYTDEDHSLIQKELIDILQREYGYSDLYDSRTTVKDNLLQLQAYHEMRGLHEIYSRVEKRRGGVEVHKDFKFFHDFTYEELYLMIDSILFSKHIPNHQKEDLINKLESLTSEHFDSRAGSVETLESHETMNKQLFVTIGVLNDAISSGKKVRFHYTQFDVEDGSKLVSDVRRTASGEPREYVINPYRLVATNGRYYLICNYDKYDDLSHYRVDRILDIQIVDEQRKLFDEVSDVAAFDVDRYMREHIYMFAGEIVRSKIRFHKRILDEFVDWFGTNGIRFMDESDDEVTVSVQVNETALQKWAVQYGVHVRVLEPKSVVDSVKEDIRKALENYEI